MKKNTLRIASLLLSLAAVWFFTRSGDSNGGSEGVKGMIGEPERGSISDSKRIVNSAEVPLSGALEKQAGKRIADAVQALKGGDLEPDEARRVLKELRDYLGSLPPAVAAGVMAEVLKNPTLDSATGLDFIIGDNGFLSEPSSLRVALLDWLAQFDLKTAGEVAARILSAPTHPDEWAVGLRNFARANPTADSFEFLRTKTEELIRNPDWRDKPSVGYFEAFDTLVYTKAVESSDLLSELVSDRSPEGRPYAHASFLTLDRLVIAEPVQMMRELAARPELVEARGQMVGNMFARADLREAEQRELVREYLLDPKRTGEELAAFSGVYPNNNYSVSKNLLTGNDGRTNDQLVAHDRAALEIVRSWLSDPAFESVRPHVEMMNKRLEIFVGQSAK